MKASRMLWGATGFAFVLSLASAWFLGPHTPDDLRFDSVQYHTLAVNLVQHHVYSLDGALRHWPPGLESGREWYPDKQPETYWAPGYPAFLAAVYELAGPNLWAVYLAQALLFCGTLYLAHGITSYVTGSERIASYATVAMACWPAFYTVMMCSIMGEALFGFLAAASLSMLIKVIRGGGPWFALGCGAMLTVAALTKPAIVPFVPFAAGFAMFTGGGQRVMNGAAVLAGFALFLAPWVIRNRVVTGRLIPLSTAGPLNLYLGNSPEYYVAGDINIRHWTDCRQFQGASRAEQEKALASLAFTRMAADPIGAIALFARKTSIMWLGGLGRPPRISGPLSSVRVAGLAMESQAVLFIPAFVLALYGWMTLGRRTRKRALPVVMLMACVTLSYALTFSTMRYSTPLNPYLLAFAMAGLLHRRPVESET